MIKNHINIAVLAAAVLSAALLPGCCLFQKNSQGCLFNKQESTDTDSDNPCPESCPADIADARTTFIDTPPAGGGTQTAAAQPTHGTVQVIIPDKEMTPEGSVSVGAPVASVPGTVDTRQDELIVDPQSNQTAAGEIPVSTTRFEVYTPSSAASAPGGSSASFQTRSY
ncbi:MAG: hypothetical protein IIZ25_05675 [Thermoguttaceae bacterium]|nr:hypothetical protein [Thermoguttaceae bacterium]